MMPELDVDERLIETFIFVSKLLFAGLIFQAVLYINPSTYQVQVAFTSMVSGLLSAAGIELTHSGIRIFTTESAYIIVQDCLGWKSMAAFLGLVWASTSRTVEHLNFILAALGVLVIGNIIRVFSTVYLAEIGWLSFELIHGILWRWSLTLLVLGMWAYWLRNWKEKKKFDERIKEQVRKVN